MALTSKGSNKFFMAGAVIFKDWVVVAGCFFYFAAHMVVLAFPAGFVIHLYKDPGLKCLNLQIKKLIPCGS